MSAKTMLSNTHQLHRKHQICLHEFEVLSEIYYSGQDLVFKVAFLSSLSMFPWNPVNLTVIFLAADSYLFYAPSTSLGQASQGTRFLLSRIEHFKSEATYIHSYINFNIKIGREMMLQSPESYIERLIFSHAILW